MKLEIFSFGKSKETGIIEAEAEYLKRLTGKAQVKMIELATTRNASASLDVIRAKESKLFLDHIEPSDYLVVLDENGKQKTSHEFAGWLQDLMNHGVSNLRFAIGSPFGWHGDVKKRANLLLSLSKLTFPAHLARLLLIEQIYRGMSIISGSSYHKD